MSHFFLILKKVLPKKKNAIIINVSRNTNRGKGEQCNEPHQHQQTKNDRNREKTVARLCKDDQYNN